MKKLFSILFIAASFAATGLAQNGFAIQSGASYVNHTNDSPSLGSNATAALYYTGSPFPTRDNASHNCPPPSQICGGVKVKLTSEKAINNVIYSDYITVLYASPSQINVITPVFPHQSSNWTVDIEFYPRIGIPSVPERTKTGVFFEMKNIQPYLVTMNLGGSTQPMLVGTLYGYTVDENGAPNGSVALKSLTDGVANPRTYNGLPTFFQAYWSGGRNNQDSLRTYYNDHFFRDSIIYNVYPGQSVANIEVMGYGTWDSGLQQIKIHYGIGPATQGNPTNGYVWFAN
jgi:hypothetical protein